MGVFRDGVVKGSGSRSRIPFALPRLRGPELSGWKRVREAMRRASKYPDSTDENERPCSSTIEVTKGGRVKVVNWSRRRFVMDEGRVLPWSRAT